jgi:hypothetical protein
MVMAFRGSAFDVDFLESSWERSCVVPHTDGPANDPLQVAQRLHNPLAMDQRSRQAPQQAATEIVGRITERLAGRVKGLTALFCGLLLTDRPGDVLFPAAQAPKPDKQMASSDNSDALSSRPPKPAW